MEAAYGLAARHPAAPSSAGTPDAVLPQDGRRLHAALSRIPGIAPEACVSSLLPGGLTNRNYRVDCPDGHRVFVRLSEASTSQLGIDRAAEHANSEAAARAGVAPRVLSYVPEHGALALDWIDAQTLDGADLDDSIMIVRVATQCRSLHEGPAFRGSFDMFALQERYLRTVEAHGFRRPADYLDHLPAVAAIRAAVAVNAPASVPCHNDLLPANIMATDERVWFIDFEYAGAGDPDFELGNLWSEAHLGVDRLYELVTAYYGRTSSAKFARARLLAFMSDFGWTLWACIQAATSELDFDFYSWGLAKYERALAVLRSADLSRLISDAMQAEVAVQNAESKECRSA